MGCKLDKDGNINIKSYSVPKIKNIKSINVLFTDFEGCLESILDEYPDFLKQLRLVIYEADQRHICNYKKIETILSDIDKKKKEVNGQNYVWLK